MAVERFFNICKPFNRNLVRKMGDRELLNLFKESSSFSSSSDLPFFSIILYSKLRKSYKILTDLCLLQGSVWNGKGYIIMIIIFSVLFNVNKLFEYETIYVEIVDIDTNTS